MFLLFFGAGAPASLPEPAKQINVLMQSFGAGFEVRFRHACYVGESKVIDQFGKQRTASEKKSDI